MPAALTMACLLPFASAVPPAAPTADFTRDIAPLLAAKCFKCHGPDGSARKAELRLDKRDGALRADAHGVSAIVPGDPDASELIARVTNPDPDERMPPADGNVALTPTEVSALRAWIAAGALYAKHWSWQALPDGAPGNSPLAASGVANSVDALAWLRRVTFDITGLPPASAECVDFARDSSPAARTRVVDALLASPHYGERWGRHWMDVMRFAETHGHEFDYQIDEAWRWRDWVIRAFNSDVPYAQFVREQIAGDLLTVPRLNPEDGTNESVTATGWWWMAQGTHAPVDVRLDQAERIDNQIDVATKAFLGTTASCARCHDHKFDDVSQRDYYALFGVLKSSRRAYAYQDQHGVIGHAVEVLAAEVRASVESHAAAALAPADSPAPAGTTWNFNSGTFEDWTLSGWAFGNAPLSAGDSLAPEGRPPVEMTVGCAHSGRISNALQGTMRSPAFIVPEGLIRVRCAGDKCRIRLIIDGYFLDDRNALLFEGFIQDVDHPTQWRTHTWDTKRYAGELAYLEVSDDGDGFVAVDWVALGELPEAACVPAPAPVPAGAPRKRVDVPAPVRVLAMEDGTGMDSPLYVRGSAHKMGDLVPRGMIAELRADTPGALGDAVPATGSGRLALAEELVAPNNPLTWRVMANRVWHHMMGQGIVPSTDDFGVLGRAPADKELLDYLAMRLRAHGSVKQLVREIALSAAYADASRPLRRLDGEALRDAVVATCGGLDLTMGGPSIPVHLTDAMQGRGRPGQSGPLDGARRRSVYLEIRRNFLNPFMQVFDQPVPTTTVGARSVSNVPAQGLTLMNDPFVRGQAERWGTAVAAEPGAPVDRVRAMFQRAYARDATDVEVEGALRLMAFAAASDPAARSDPAAWCDLAHAILLSAEFRYLR